MSTFAKYFETLFETSVALGDFVEVKERKMRSDLDVANAEVRKRKLIKKIKTDFIYKVLVNSYPSPYRKVGARGPRQGRQQDFSGHFRRYSGHLSPF